MSQELRSGRVPWYFWAIGVVALLWNGVGALDYVMTQTRNETYLAEFTPEQIAYFLGFPAWAIGAWAVGVWGGVIGALLLLLRRRLAVPAFLVSLIALIVTSIYNFALTDGLAIMGGPTALVITVVIFVTTIALLLYARAMEKRGILV